MQIALKIVQKSAIIGWLPLTDLDRELGFTVQVCCSKAISPYRDVYATTSNHVFYSHLLRHAVNIKAKLSPHKKAPYLQLPPFLAILLAVQS